MKLHQLTDEGLALQELIESNPDFDISKALIDFQGEFNTKVVSLGMVYRNIQAEVGVYKAESKRLADIAVSKEKRAEGLRVYVEREMEQLGIESIKGDTFSVKFRKLPDVVEIVDEEQVPHDFCKHTPEKWTPIKDKIEDEFKQGNKVDGAKWITDRKKLEIK